MRYIVYTFLIMYKRVQDPNLANEDWSRFLPNFKKKNTSKRRKPHVVAEKKPYTPFPPAQQPSKIDLQLDSGEYFLNQTQREENKKAEKQKSAKEKSLEKKRKRESEFVPPSAAAENNNAEVASSKESKKKKRRE